MSTSEHLNMSLSKEEEDDEICHLAEEGDVETSMIQREDVGSRMVGLRIFVRKSDQAAEVDIPPLKRQRLNSLSRKHYQNDVSSSDDSTK